MAHFERDTDEARKRWCPQRDEVRLKKRVSEWEWAKGERVFSIIRKLRIRKCIGRIHYEGMLCRSHWFCTHRQHFGKNILVAAYNALFWFGLHICTAFPKAIIPECRRPLTQIRHSRWSRPNKVSHQNHTNKALRSAIRRTRKTFRFLNSPSTELYHLHKQKANGRTVALQCSAFSVTAYIWCEQKDFKVYRARYFACIRKRYTFRSVRRATVNE